MLALSPPGGPEWLLVLLIFVLLFGARKLPELGGSVGKSIKNFKKGLGEGKEDAASSDGDVAAQEPVTGKSARNDEQ